MTLQTYEYTKLYILYLLDKHPHGSYGRRIKVEMENKLSNYWKPSDGMIYPILRELEQDGFVEGTWISGKTKNYVITEEGKEELERELEFYESIIHDSFNMFFILKNDLYDTNQNHLEKNLKNYDVCRNIC